MPNLVKMLEQGSKFHKKNINQAWINPVAHQPVKDHFQERKNTSSCVSSFYLPRLNKDLCISVCPTWP